MLQGYSMGRAAERATMTYKDHLWSAIIGEADKFGKRITRAKRERYMKLTKHWSRATK